MMRSVKNGTWEMRKLRDLKSVNIWGCASTKEGVRNVRDIKKQKAQE